METWTTHLPELFVSLSSPDYFIPEKYRLGTDAYLVPSPDHQDLTFSFPVCFRRPLLEEISLPLSSSAGAVHAIIEYCKQASGKIKDVGMLYGARTGNQGRYMVNVEPCTVALSMSALASHLWRPDDGNLLTPEGIRLTIRGAMPYLPVSSRNSTFILDELSTYLQSIAECIHRVPIRQIKREWEIVYDQQHLRSKLSEMGLVSFIGDGTRPARSYTRYRCWHRVAGPKDGVHIPFNCPVKLEPVEVMLAGSNHTITGLGIHKGEIFAITGSNAEGKSTLLNAIEAGEDDHAIGDGRECLVTIAGGVSPDATSIELKGADLRPFFQKIPPGMAGRAESAFGQGSGSSSMAYRISDAIRRATPYIVIDEDRAAQNLMVPCYMSSSDVRSLASLLAEAREWCNGTTFIIAGSGMELLIAQADRIIRLCQHTPRALSVDTYRAGLTDYYQKIERLIPNNSGKGNIHKQ
ncbi:MAG TPA: ABC-ATPase domain-containing protein [Methanospirillum sp.]|uniref:P-loop domain-containing protein n=1 Tax=Methanospirillum sp. TaxID=45200 RepID=UPI002C073FAB|nr:P-loop domain-containing protein [Methanospirillum sp.]HOJ95226.1 ABC-ATPase domain-containing protein [Methanospirillum sp.]HPP78575.1 ABC-ATPase domain-containing protein [Methanospirillum sp.]